jgi:hypothetical protein
MDYEYLTFYYRQVTELLNECRKAVKGHRANILCDYSYRYINIIWFCCDWLAMSNSCYNPFIYGIYNVSTADVFFIWFFLNFSFSLPIFSNTKSRSLSRNLLYSLSIIIFLWNTKINFRLHNSPPLAPVSRLVSSFHTFTSLDVFKTSFCNIPLSTQ